MTPSLPDLRSVPFHLDDAAVAWVEETARALNTRERLAQLLMPLAMELRPEALEAYIRAGVSGLCRPAGAPAGALRASASSAQELARVPLLMSADLEGGEGNIIGGAGTPYPNQLAIGATDDPQVAANLARIGAREGRACGFNWHFGPVVDLDLNPLNAIVNTRAFGNDPARVAALGVATVQAMQQQGVACTAKHWPGDGVDWRNQHLVTSENTLEMAEWRASYGQVYRAMIEGGVLTVMSAHITLPAYARERGQPRDADLPATLSGLLNVELLRGELGFQGLIVTDATEMGGFQAHGRRPELIVRALNAGSDLILFGADVEGDLDTLEAALADGRLGQQRVDEALSRVLALKAALGLHRGTALPDESVLGQPEHHAWAQDAAERSVTLVRDDQHLLPLSPQRHRRLLLIQSPQRRGVFGQPLPPLQIDALLRESGFDVTLYDPQTVVAPDAFDVLLYVVSEEGGLVREHLTLDWPALHGGPIRAMQRHWDTLPTALLSLGNPHHGLEVPRCRTLVNAYSPVLASQRAAVDALTGRRPFSGRDPVDAAAFLRPTPQAGGR